jgi:glycosyl transferase, family 25
MLILQYFEVPTQPANSHTRKGHGGARLCFFVFLGERSSRGFTYCEKSRGKKKGLVIVLTRATITSPHYHSQEALMEELPLILVINMTRDVERWNKISSALRKLGLPFVRIRAIDARRKFGLVRSRMPRPYFSATDRQKLSPGEYCCALSHIAALKRVIRLKARSAIILEDDAEFDYRFKDLVTGALHDFLYHCDIVKLQGTEYTYTSKTGPILAQSHVAQLILPMRPTLGAIAYAVTQVGARRLIAACAPIADPLDHMLAYYERHHIPYAETRPFLVWQACVPSTLDAERNAWPLILDAPATVANIVRRHRIYRGMVRAALAARLIARARLRTIVRYTGRQRTVSFFR